MRRASLLAGAVALWGSGALVASLVWLATSGSDRAEPYSVVRLGERVAPPPRPESLSWSPLRIAIAPVDYRESWRAGLDLAAAGEAIALSAADLGIGPPTEAEFKAAADKASRSVRKAAAATTTEASSSDSTRPAAGALAYSVFAGRRLIWSTRADARGRNYRCLVSIAAWEARAMATVDWHLRLAGLAPAAISGPRTEGQPGDWLDARFCEPVGSGSSSGAPGLPVARRQSSSAGAPAAGGGATSRLPVDWVQFAPEAAAPESTAGGSAGAAQQPLPRERVMQSL